MQIPSNISPEDLLRYAQDEINKKAAAERAERQAIRDQQLEKLEALRVATVKADAERDRLADPAFRAAELIQRAVGDDWAELVALLKASSMARVAAAINRLDAQRDAAIRHAGVTTAGPTRQDAQAVAVAERKTRIERQLAEAGVLADVTPEVDAA